MSRLNRFSIPRLTFLFGLSCIIVCTEVTPTPITLSVNCGGRTLGTVKVALELANADPKWGVNIVARFFPNSDPCPEGYTFDGDFRWIQMITTNTPMKDWGDNLPGTNKETGLYEYIDPWSSRKVDEVYELKDDEPFYLTDEIRDKAIPGWFGDKPRREYKIGDPLQTWTAETALVCVKEGVIRFLGSFKWGWERYRDTDGDPNRFILTPKPTNGSSLGTVSPDLIKLATTGDYSEWSAGGGCCCKKDEVPEPSTMVLLAFGAVALITTRRRVR